MWTKTIPTVEGFYWAKSPKTNLTAPVYVLPKNKIIISFNATIDFYSVQYFQFQFWSEKLQEPPESKPASDFPRG